MVKKAVVVVLVTGGLSFAAPVPAYATCPEGDPVCNTCIDDPKCLCIDGDDTTVCVHHLMQVR